jgi:hypothetical protein
MSVAPFAGAALVMDVTPNYVAVELPADAPAGKSSAEADGLSNRSHSATERQTGSTGLGADGLLRGPRRSADSQPLSSSLGADGLSRVSLPAADRQARYSSPGAERLSRTSHLVGWGCQDQGLGWQLLTGHAKGQIIVWDPISGPIQAVAHVGHPNSAIR